MTAHAPQVPDGAEIRQLIDNHVLDMVINDQLYRLETLLINAYDHLLDIRGTKRNKTAFEIAEVKQLSHIIRFLNEHDKYKVILRLCLKVKNAFLNGYLKYFFQNSLN